MWQRVGVMYKDKERQKQVVKEAVRKHRQGITKGITEPQGITSLPVYHILDKLTDKKWRENLGYQCSHLRPNDKECTYLGGFPLDTVCDWFECTNGQ